MKWKKIAEKIRDMIVGEIKEGKAWDKSSSIIT